jgi:hypothetical protein
MAILEILAAAQGGAYFSNAGKAAGLSAAAAQTAMAKLCPIIAQDLKTHAQNDPDAFENLLDLLEDDGDADFDDVETTTGAEALADGTAVLADLYGSRVAAETKLARFASGLTSDSLNTISAISAVSVLTSLAQSNASSLKSGDIATATASSSGGFFSVVFAALLKGLLQGVARQLAPKRRRRRSYTDYFGRRRTTTKRRRASTPSLETIFRDLLTKR